MGIGCSPLSTFATGSIILLPEVCGTRTLVYIVYGMEQPFLDGISHGKERAAAGEGVGSGPEHASDEAYAYRSDAVDE